MAKADTKLTALEKRVNVSPNEIAVFYMDRDNRDLYYLSDNKAEKLTRAEIGRRYPENKYIVIYVTYIKGAIPNE